MARARVFHNPHCSKSRQSLALLRQRLREEEIEVVEYLKAPPNREELRSIATKLALRPKDFIRRKEVEFAAMKLAEKLDDDEALFTAMVQAPKLLERPIVEVGGKAALGRPPEAILALLED